MNNLFIIQLFFKRAIMKKNYFFSFPIPLIFLVITINNGYYNHYNQVPPFSENYYDRSTNAVYPNRTPEEKLISAKINQAFFDDPNLFNYASSIEVYTTGNEVTLSGQIDSDRIKLRAESKAKNILGVKKVNNLIRVQKTK